MSTTVDGRNPAPVEVGSLSESIIYRVSYISGGCLGFLNHQQYILQVTSSTRSSFQVDQV